MKFLYSLFLFNLFLFAQEPNLENKEQSEIKNQEEDFLNINNSFITKYEYGKMLFNNPRGIGCSNCHGEDARGRKIVEFKHVHDKKTYDCSLVAPDIKDIEYELFYTKVNSKRNPNLKFEKEQVCDKLIHYANVMPTYFLVEEEIEAIYYYIRNLKETK